MKNRSFFKPEVLCLSHQRCEFPTETVTKLPKLFRKEWSINMEFSKLISLLISMIVTMWPTLASCDEPQRETLIADAVETAVEELTADANIVNNGKSSYLICVSDEASDYVKAAAEELSAAIYQKTAAYVPVTNKVGEMTVFINYDGDGHTADIGKCGYSIIEKDGCVYIDGATEEALTCALYLFDRNFIETSENGNITVPDGTSIVKKSDEKLILADYIDMGIPVETELKVVGLYDGVTVDSKKYYIAQGAATDGDHIYVVLKHNEFEGVVVKTDFNGKILKISNVYDFGHANDMTFDTDKNLIVLVHGTSSENTKNGNGNGRRFSLLDPDTLEVIHSPEAGFDIGKEAGAISYNTETGVYTIGRLCTYYHQFKMNSDYSLSYSFSTLRGSAESEKRVDYIGQGLGGDNRYVYFPYSGIQRNADGNLLVVYDNFGKYVTTLKIDSPMESESLFFDEGRYYICFNWGSGYIHELLYKPVYRASDVDFSDIGDELITAQDEVKMYSDTSTDGAVVKTLKKGEKLRANGFSADGKWYRIKLPYGGIGYIESGLLMPAQIEGLTEYSIETKVKAAVCEVYRIPCDFFNDSSEQIFTLAAGTPVTVTGKVEGTFWVRIEANGRIGFAVSIKLEKIDWKAYQ